MSEEVSKFLDGLPLNKLMDMFNGTLDFVVEELAGFSVPDILPGETPLDPMPDDYMFGHNWLGLDGKALPGDWMARTLVGMRIKTDPGNKLLTEFNQGDLDITVSTVFIGEDYFRAGEVPKPWETMIWVSTCSNPEWKARYQTRNAAFSGHAAVLDLIVNRASSAASPGLEV